VGQDLSLRGKSWRTELVEELQEGGKEGGSLFHKKASHRVFLVWTRGGEKKHGGTGELRGRFQGGKSSETV